MRDFTHTVHFLSFSLEFSIFSIYLCLDSVDFPDQGQKSVTWHTARAVYRTHTQLIIYWSTHFIFLIFFENASNWSVSHILHLYMTFVVPIMVNIMVTVFWDVMPCSLVSRVHFGGTCCLDLSWRWRQHNLNEW